MLACYRLLCRIECLECHNLMQDLKQGGVCVYVCVCQADWTKTFKLVKGLKLFAVSRHTLTWDS